MADLACDFCPHEDICPYAYEYSDCYVERIKAAKAVVDEEFKAFCVKIEAKNENMDDDSVNNLIRNMKWLIQDSEQPLPDLPDL